ncbi:hypothetical protein IL992_21855 [Microbispora sp. NEAU-D428]|uniref:hypothetical protein n=1 Tax=Microbispora sitophila TaxID=2771537 RepID=UPI00186698BD|nr:hypothetical protein [Microbispora sitophila]MBE3011824.1 hypothetical protein [Microbispora sitophila]
MISKLNRLGDRLLDKLLPGAEAQADTCYSAGRDSLGCYYNCYPNPNGSICVRYRDSSCHGYSWVNVGSC